MSCRSGCPSSGGATPSWGLSHVVHLFHPDILIIGGGLSLLGRPLQESVQRQLPDFVMNAFLPPPPVELAALNEDVVPLGALALTRMNTEPFPDRKSNRLNSSNYCASRMPSSA